METPAVLPQKKTLSWKHSYLWSLAETPTDIYKTQPEVESLSWFPILILHHSSNDHCHILVACRDMWDSPHWKICWWKVGPSIVASGKWQMGSNTKMFHPFLFHIKSNQSLLLFYQTYNSSAGRMKWLFPGITKNDKRLKEITSTKTKRKTHIVPESHPLLI